MACTVKSVKLRTRYLLTCLAMLPLTACARCAPSKVGHGVSRLTIRNVGAVATVALADTRCGFASEAVQATPTIEGRVGQLGTLTYTVTNCEIAYPEDAPYVSQDCNGTQTVVRGRVVVNATQVIQGIITGSPETPVIPSGPDSATLNIRANLENFSAESTVSQNILTVYEGSLEAVMRPRLAVDSDQGACSIPTTNVRFESVRYQPSEVHVKTDSRSFDVSVDSSELFAVNGQYADFENELWGEITVWGQYEPIDGGDEGLDPDYARENFHASYACAEGLAQPTTFTCDGFLAPVLAQNAARLSVRTLGRVAHLLEQDTKCGFSAPQVQAQATLMGSVGGFGSATQTAESCEIIVPPDTVIREDCLGTKTFASGRVIVSGTKTITGRLTGDPVTPAVPMSDAPAVIEVHVEAFDDFKIIEAGAGLRMLSGQMSGTLTPRTAQDSSLSNACAYVTSIARLSDISYDAETTAQLISDEVGTFDITLGETRIQALSGTWGPDENQLDGYVELNGERWDLPTNPDDDGLDPEYNREAFDRTWICDSIVEPVSHSCEFTAPLAQGASQLTIQMAGALAKALDGNAECGFSDPGVNIVVEGELGRRDGMATYHVTRPCRMDFGARTVLSTDCNGVSTYASGVVEVTGTKVIRGIVTGDTITPIVPTDRTPAEIRFDARVENFAVWADPEAEKLTGKSGRLTGGLVPRTGIDAATGACSIATPVADLVDITWHGANVRIENEGKLFDLRLERSDLLAHNGDGEDRTNYLAGTLQMDGQSWDIPVDGNTALVPAYDQATFDASYACTEGLTVAQNDAQCDMYQVLGENVARLIALSAGTIAADLNADDECGFEDFWVKTNPDRVEGDTGDLGLLEWNIDGCTMGRSGSSQQQPVSIDCNGRERFWGGSTRIDAQRIVTGMRVDEYWIFDSIEPDDPTSVEIDLQQVLLTNFEVWEDESGVVSPLRALAIEGGTLSGVVAPITAERADDHGIFDISTPVAQMRNLSLSGAPVTVRAEGMTFKLFVSEANFNAFNGSYNGLGLTNELQGYIVIDGVRVDFDTGLDPAFNQADFNASYVCSGDMRNPVPHN